MCKHRNTHTHAALVCRIHCVWTFSTASVCTPTSDHRWKTIVSVHIFRINAHCTRNMWTFIAVSAVACRVAWYMARTYFPHSLLQRWDTTIPLPPDLFCVYFATLFCMPSKRLIRLGMCKWVDVKSCRLTLIIALHVDPYNKGLNRCIFHWSLFTPANFVEICFKPKMPLEFMRVKGIFSNAARQIVI